MKLRLISVAADIAFTSLALEVDRPSTPAKANPSDAACLCIGDARPCLIDDGRFCACWVNTRIEFTQYPMRGPNAFAMQWSVECGTD